MVRLGEAGSRDLYPVSQYYSRKLVTYIRLETSFENKMSKTVSSSEMCCK